MKRLIRKAGNQITLYHGTSLELFRSIINDGRISPRSENGNISHNGFDDDKEMAVWYKKGEVHKNNEKSIQFNEMNISLYDGIDLISLVQESTYNATEFDSKLINFNQDLQVYVESEIIKILSKYERLKEVLEIDNGIASYNWEDLKSDQEDDTKKFIEELKSKEIDIVEKTYNSNVDEYVVFLGIKEAATTYAESSSNDVGVLIEINTDESTLGPDTNDVAGSLDFFSDVPLWKQSYDSIGQVVQYGPIDIGQITSVTFINKEANDSDFDLDFEEDDIILEDLDGIELDAPEESVEDTKETPQLTFNQALSLDEAINEINVNYQSNVQARTRLKKRIVI